MKLDKSPENSNATALGFDGVKDVVDRADQVSENLHYGFPVHNFNLIERYEKAEVNVVCRVVLNGRVATQFDLLIGAAPYGSDGHYERLGSRTERKTDVENEGTAPNSQKRVFIGIVDFIESPEGVIPSSVWLEGSKERPDFLRELFSPTFHAVFKGVGATGKGKRALTGTRFNNATGDSHSVAGVVESCAEMVSSFNREMPDDVWEWLIESEFMSFVIGAIRIRLYDKGVWFGCEESTRFDFDICNVFICPNNLSA